MGSSTHRFPPRPEQTNGEGPEPQDMPQPLRDIAEAVFETKETVSHIAEEVLIHGHKIDRVADVVDGHDRKLGHLTESVGILSRKVDRFNPTLPDIPIDRDSYSDLERQEVTSSGIERFVITKEEMQARDARRIREAIVAYNKEKEGEKNTALIKGAKKFSGRIAASVMITASLGLGGAIYHAILWLIQHSGK